MSFRFRLVLVNTLLILALLLGVTLALFSITSTLLTRSIDQDLIRRSEMFLRRPRGEEGRGPMFPPPGNGDIERPSLIGENGNPARFDPENGEVSDDPNAHVLSPEALAAAKSSSEGWATVSDEGEKIRVLVAKLGPNSPFKGYVQVAHRLGDLQRLATAQATLIGVAAPVALILAAIGGWWLAGQALKPVRELSDASSQVNEKDLNVSLPVRGQDELATVAQNFNAMVSRLRGSFQERDRLLHQLEQSLEQQKQFVADASHELRTPLAQIRLTSSGALEEGTSPADAHHALEIIDRSAAGMARLVEQLLALARMDGSNVVDAHATSNLRQAVETAMDALPPGGAKIVLEGSPVVVHGSEDDLVRAIRNLLENALRFAPATSEIQVKVGEDGSVEVRDEGPGISADHLPNLGKRFYRADPSRDRKQGGTGLGLAIVKAIAERWDGRLEIQSELGRGTSAKLFLKKVEKS